MAEFWSLGNVDPAKESNFIVRIGDKDFNFLAKSVSKPTLETDVNEYRLINQIVKFPSIPKWNDITIRFIDSPKLDIHKQLIELMVDTQNVPKKEWVPDAIEKSEKTNLVIEQYNAEAKLLSTWMFENPFISSINFGENDYSSDKFVEIEVIVVYDYAYLE
jgi:hypothetical protein